VLGSWTATGAGRKTGGRNVAQASFIPPMLLFVYYVFDVIVLEGVDVMREIVISPAGIARTKDFFLPSRTYQIFRCVGFGRIQIGWDLIRILR